MLSCQRLRLLCGLGVLSGSVYAQCYDLTGVHLYEVKGRFQERWDKPIWDAKPGEGNFHLDESPWLGGIPEFVIFAIGRVQRTESGWVPQRKSRIPETWCELSPQRNSYYFCYAVPYQTPPPGAFRVPPIENDLEKWSLGSDGLLRYTRHTQGVSVFDQTYDFGGGVEAVLDLNTGSYSVIAHGHSKNHYTKRIPEGVELWRDTTLSAKVKLVPQPCPATLRKAALLPEAEVREEMIKPVPVCAVKPKPPIAGLPASFEFVANPSKATSPLGCVVVHEEPMPREDLRLAKGKEQR
jgi:hypothetical protein